MDLVVTEDTFHSSKLFITTSSDSLFSGKISLSSNLLESFLSDEHASGYGMWLLTASISLSLVRWKVNESLPQSLSNTSRYQLPPLSYNIVHFALFVDNSSTSASVER